MKTTNFELMPMPLNEIELEGIRSMDNLNNILIGSFTSAVDRQLKEMFKLAGFEFDSEHRFLEFVSNRVTKVESFNSKNNVKTSAVIVDYRTQMQKNVCYIIESTELRQTSVHGIEGVHSVTVRKYVDCDYPSFG